MGVELLANLLLTVGVLTVLGIRALVPKVRRARALAAARRQLGAGAARLADHELVTVTGTVRAHDDLVEAPLSGRRVVFHHTVAYVRGMRVELVASALASFELETDQGIVRIEGDAAANAFTPRPIPRQVERVKRFLEARGIEGAYHVGTFVREVALAPGARVTACGVARVELDPARAGERGYRDGAPARMTIRAVSEYPVLLGPPK